MPTPATPVADPLLGTVLGGKYRLEAVIADGGTGRVYRAAQEHLGRAVALKLMHVHQGEGSAADRFAERFFREAAAAGQLRHPNVVTVFDVGWHSDGRCYIVMELLEGQSLAEMMRRGPLAPEVTVELFKQIVRGVRHAHHAGMVHRDLKPANVMVIAGEDLKPAVKVLDFGLVKRMNDGDQSGAFPVANAALGEDITHVGTFLGTPAYVAPEQALGKEADARADIYSIGVMLYRALTGKLPFDANNSEAQILAHRNLPIPPMATRAPNREVPIALEAITRRCLEKRPEDRFPDTDALLAALGAAIGPPVVTAIPNDEPLTTMVLPPTDAPAPSRRGLWIGLTVALFGASALVLVGIVGFFFWGRAPDAPVPDGAAAAPVVATPPPEVTPPPPTEPAGPRTVWVLVSSTPPGATVHLGDRTLGTTPYADPLPVDGDTVTLTVRKDGYADATVTLDTSGEKATGDATLRPLGGKRTPVAPVATNTPLAAVVADDVRFTGAEAAAAVRWVNAATRQELLDAGIAAHQVNILLEKRPFADVAAMAATPFIGEKTVEAVKGAAGR